MFLFQNRDFDLYYQAMQQKKKISHIGNSVGGVMLISIALTLLLNFGLGIFLLLIGKTNWLNDAGVLLVLQIIFSVIVLMLPPLLLPALTGNRLSEIFMAKRVPLHTGAPLILIGFGVVALANIGNNVFASFLTAFGMAPVGHDFDIPTGFFGILLTFISGAFFPALVEEFAMRGVILGVLKKHFGSGTAIVVSSILFSIMHGNLVQIPFALLIGLYLGYITVYTGSVFPAVILHFINNFISFALDMLTTNLGPTAASVISLLYFVLMLCFGLAGILWFTKTNDRLDISCGETKKYTLGVCKSPCMIIYFILIGIEVVLTQIGVY